MAKEIDSLFRSKIGGLLIVDPELGTVYNTKTKRYLGTNSWNCAVSIHHNGKNYALPKSRLIWLAARGEIPDKQFVTRCDKTGGANISNLCLVNCKELRQSSTVNRKPRWQKLTAQQVQEIRTYSFEHNYSLRVIAKRYNISHPTVCSILKGETWYSIPYVPVEVELFKVPRKPREVKPREPREAKVSLDKKPVNRVKHAKDRRLIESYLKHLPNISTTRLITQLKHHGSRLSESALTRVIEEVRTT